MLVVVYVFSTVLLESYIGSNGAAAIADALTVNHTLTTLSLRGAVNE